MSKQQMDKRLLDFVKDALREYEQEVEKTNLKSSAKHTYIHHAKAFVRWLDDSFTPGAKT